MFFPQIFSFKNKYFFVSDYPYYFGIRRGGPCPSFNARWWPTPRSSDIKDNHHKKQPNRRSWKHPDSYPSRPGHSYSSGSRSSHFKNYSDQEQPSSKPRWYCCGPFCAGCARIPSTTIPWSIPRSTENDCDKKPSSCKPRIPPDPRTSGPCGPRGPCLGPLIPSSDPEDRRLRSLSPQFNGARDSASFEVRISVFSPSLNYCEYFVKCFVFFCNKCLLIWFFTLMYLNFYRNLFDRHWLIKA